MSARAFLQKVLVEDVSGLELSFVTSLYTAILMLPVMAYYLYQSVPVSPAVWLSIAFVGASNGVALFLFFRALKIEDLSIASPLKQTIPLFVAILEPLFLATGYAVNVLTGAFLTVAGSYVVMFEGENYLEPLRRLVSPGALMALGSAFFFGIGSIAVKFIVSNIPVGFFLSLVFWFGALTLGAAVYSGKGIEMRNYWRRSFVYLAIVTAATQALIFYTIYLSTASEATILFRLSIVFNVLIGVFMFEEENLLYRMAGAVLIILGILFIV